MTAVNTGNLKVDAIAHINFEGDITPKSWYKHIVYQTPKGEIKVDRLAIDILSDICYWYRPYEKRHEITGESLGWHKKFQGGLLRRSCDAFAEILNTTTRCIRESIKVLESLGLVKAEYLPIRTPYGCLPNVMHIDIFPDAIAKITHRTNTYSDAETLEKSLLTKWVTSSYEMRNEGLRNASTPVTKSSDHLYIENSLEIKKENSVPPLPPKGEAHTPLLDEEALKSRLPSAPENIESMTPGSMGLGNAEEISGARDNKARRVREGDKYFGTIRHKRQQRSFAAKLQSTIIPIEAMEPWCDKTTFAAFEAYLLEEAKTWDCKNPAGYVANKLSNIASGKAPRTEFTAWQESLREAEEAAQQAELEAQAQQEETKLTIAQETWVTLMQQLATVTGFIEVHVGEGVDCGVKKLMVRSNDKRLGTAPLETAMERIPLSEIPKKYRQFYDELLAKAKQIASHLQFPAPVAQEEALSW